MTEVVESPCRNICRLGNDMVCDGCGRTVEEIAGWLDLSPDERRSVMDRVNDWRPREPPNPSQHRR